MAHAASRAPSTRGVNSHSDPNMKLTWSMLKAANDTWVYGKVRALATQLGYK